MLRWFILAAVWAVVSAANPDYPKGFNDKFCKVPPNNGGRDFPKIADDYMARMEWNDYIERRTLLMSEYVSVANNMGTTYVTGLKAPGITTKYITDASTGELFIIYDAEAVEFEDGNCVVKKLDKNEEFALPFKADPKYPGSDKLLNGKSLLTLGATQVGNLMYTGTEQMNGITCDVFVGCLYIAEGQITLSATYHFSDSSWKAAGAATTSPVRIHVKGSSFTDSNYALEQSFDYAYFSTRWPTENAEYFARVFETPPHTYCPGRFNTYRIPDVPTHFSFRMEVIDNLAETIMITKEFYDFQSNYSRLDFKAPPTGNNTVDSAASPSSIINDFGTGVSYVIDKFTKACTARPIRSSEFDSMAIGGGQTRMRSPQEFFDFNFPGKYPYQYIGEHLIRNVPCNGWISYRPFPNSDSKYNATWEWYFATKLTVIKAQDLVEDLEPIQLVIKSTQAGVDVAYNIYRFSENAPDSRVFDVRACYEKSGSHVITMQLAGNWSVYNAQDNIQLLTYWFQLAVDSFTGLRSIRVQDIQFEFFGKNIGVTFTLLGPAPIQGDIGNEVEQVALELATNRLVESFNDNLFAVYFMPDASQVTIFSPVPNTIHVIERNDDPSAYRPTNRPGGVLPQKTIYYPGLSNGAAAGLGIGILILGVILAIGGVLLYSHFTKSAGAGPSYARQHNDQ